MADAREKLNALAKAGRHRKLLSTSDSDLVQAKMPKKVKRSGVVRPYHHFVSSNNDSSGETTVTNNAVGSAKESKNRAIREENSSGSESAGQLGAAEKIAALYEPVNAEVSTAERLQARKRKLPETLGRSRDLFPPSDLLDLEKDDKFIESYILSVVGCRDFSLFKGYRALYDLARQKKSRTLFFRRPELHIIFGTGSSCTITRVLKKGVKLGLFQVQTFAFRTGQLAPGTYIHLRSPW